MNPTNCLSYVVLTCCCFAGCHSVGNSAPTNGDANTAKQTRIEGSPPSALAQKKLLERVRSPHDRSADEIAWQPSKYKGLTVGSSTKSDLFAKLGTPSTSWVWEGHSLEEPNAPVCYVYSGLGEFSSDVWVTVDNSSGVIESIILSLQKPFPAAEIIAAYGDEYLVARYSTCSKTGDIESEEPWLYRDVDGEIYVEYPQFGTYFLVDRTTYAVRDIVMSREWLGLGAIDGCDGERE